MAVGRVRPPMLLLAAALLAGCAGGGDAPAAAGGGPSGDAGAGPSDADAPPQDGTAGAAAAPIWQVGQWWTWRLEASAAPEPMEATTVVLAADGASYSIGSPDAGAAAQAYPFHLVGLGPVARDTLAWQAHGVPVRFLRFPVVDGDSWTADFWGAPGATVTVRSATVAGPGGPEPGFRSEASYAGGGLFAAASWSPARGQFVQVQSYFGGPDPFATASLVAEGLGGVEGRPFVATDLARRSASAADPPSLAPVEVAVPDEADLVLMACFLGGGPGLHQAVLDYGGPPMEGCNATTADGSLHYVAVTAEAQGGSGRLAVAPAGQGSVTVEVFAVATA
jgi:hypothetical protein